MKMEEKVILQSILNRQNNGKLSNKGETWIKDQSLARLLCVREDEYQHPPHNTWDPLRSDAVYVSKFASKPGYQDFLALANENGQLAIQDTRPAKNEGRILESSAHPNAIFDLAWAPDSMKLVTASGDQTAVLWDILPTSFQAVSVFEGHQKSVKAIDFHPTDNIFATGSRDGSIMLWDTRSRVTRSNANKPDNVIRNAHCIAEPSSRRKKQTVNYVASSITGVVFLDSNTLISSGASLGTIHVWDLRKNYTSHKSNPVPKYTISYYGKSHQCGIANLALDPSRSRLFVASMDNHIYEYNVSTPELPPIGVYGGHEQQSFYVKMCLSGDGQYILSGSSDNNAYVWKTGKSPEPLLRLVGHGMEVTSVAWCPTDITKIVTCSDDIRHRIWRPSPGVEADPDQHLTVRGKAEMHPKTKDQLADSYSLIDSFTQKLREHKSRTSVRVCSSSLRALLQIKAFTTPNSLNKFLEKTPPTSVSPVSELLKDPVTPCSSQQRSPLRVQQPSAVQIQKTASRRLDMGNAAEDNSPTRNLPNFVVDGLSPRSSPTSSGNKRKRTNWLADLSQQRREKFTKLTK